VNEAEKVNMKRSLLFFTAFLFSVVSISGQTAVDFENKFGTQTYYEIRPKILMSAKFDNNGEVCQVTFQPNKYSKKTNTIFSGGNGLDLIQLKEAFEEVVPKEWRSGQIKPPPLGFDISGTMFWGDWKTESIWIELNGTLNGGADMNFCDLLGTEKKDLQKGKYSFCTMSGTLDVLTINWIKRDCHKN
jgi:hypothetical protein